MLVDNGVKGDSRVQKQARSAAAAGWEVFLLGLSPDRRRRTWKIGEATVRLLPKAAPALMAGYLRRSARLRDPLAYRSVQVAQFRHRRLQARRADLRSRWLALTIGPAGGGPLWRLTEWTRVTAGRAVTRLRWQWILPLRVRRTEAVARRRQRLDGPFDRLVTAGWRLLLGRRAWRRLDPRLWEIECTLGGAVDRLGPDIIHANDFRTLGVAARAKLRAAAQGRSTRLVWDVHEYLPGVKPYSPSARWLPANCAHEREYAPHADAVVTVSESLADLLVAEHRPATRPTVVLNAPDVPVLPQAREPEAVSLRELCGIGPDVPLIVYSGAAAPQRGLDVMIRALPLLRGVHMALVVNQPSSPYVSALRARARAARAGGRLHVLPYVPHDQVVPFLASADVGVIPILHWPNHEIALITKFFEYAHARLPVVVSDVRTMAATVRATGQGEVFRAGDTADFLLAVETVLGDPERYRDAYLKPGLLDAWTWRSQEAPLLGVYERLAAPPPAARSLRDEVAAR